MSQSELNPDPSMREQLSALADGRLQGAELAAAVRAVTEDDDARERWQLYHLVGDVLRSPELAGQGSDEAFLARLRQHLAAEGRPGEDAQALALAHAQAQARGATWAPTQAVNDPAFRWKLAAAAASLAAVAVIGWHLAAPSAGEGRVLAQRPVLDGASVAGAAQEPAPQLMIRDPRLDELLAAHRQVGAGPALQEASGFLRNATFAASER